MLKVLFYHAGDAYSDTNDFYLGIAALYLKTYLDTNKPNIANQVEWLLPQQFRLTDDEFVDLYNQHKPDLICTSHYIWNHAFLLDQLSRIRTRIPEHVLFVAGGPSIDVNINSEFFQKYPFIDYAQYGAGEVAFADLVESIILKKKLIAFNTSNIAWYDKDKGKTIIADYKYVPQLPISPFTNNVELFTKMVNDVQTLELPVVIPYELTRGCPYSCTFCDWNSGLSNKTTRRKSSYKEEIDLFVKLKIKNLYGADANFGQYDEDVDVISYLAKKNIEENAGFKMDSNFSKLKKDKVLKILHIMAQADLLLKEQTGGITISVQDICPEVLENIDRPDVGWPVHLQMINELNQAYPDVYSKVQLIQGLPGQTLESWRATLKEIAGHKLQFMIFINELLPASPAAQDQEYHEKFKFKYSNSERLLAGSYFKGVFAESCFSFTREDFVKMTTLSHLYVTILYYRNTTSIEFDIENTVDNIINTSAYKNIQENLLNNWVMHDKFFYTIGIDGKPKEISACHAFSVAQTWAITPTFIKLISTNLSNSKNEFIKKMFAMKLTNHVNTVVVV